MTLAAALLALCACGYRFSAGEGRLPDGGRALRVAPVESALAEAGWGGELTDLLRREARRAGLRLCEDPAAPALSVRLLELQTVVRGIAAGGGRFLAREEAVRLVVEYVLGLDAAAPPRRLREEESFVVAPDLRGTQTNRALAVRRALSRLSERILSECCRGVGPP